MTQEQKAQAYDEVREKIALRFGSNVAEEVFSEFEMSEDEKVRKWLYDYFRSLFATWIHPDITCEEILAWLEKQGKQKEYTFKSIPRLLDMIEPSDKTKAYCQKLIDTLTEEGYNTDAKIVKEVLKGWNGEDVPMAVMDEQKPTDNFKSKFKVGDWVVWDNKMSCYVDNIYQGKESLMYTIIDTNNIIRSCSVKVFDDNARLWTIKDAKPGDVLKEDSCIFIIGRMKPDETAIVHCCLFDDGDFDLGSILTFDVDSTYPATKEQRDILFQKIHEEGYEWDSKNKELKKIHIIDEDKAGIDYCFTKMMNGEKVSSTWSEEDEKRLKSCLNILQPKSLLGNVETINTKWLKSIRNRITWKPSDEQIVVLELASKYERVFTPKQIDILIGLKEQLKKLKG